MSIASGLSNVLLFELAHVLFCKYVDMWNRTWAELEIQLLYHTPMRIAVLPRSQLYNEISGSFPKEKEKALEEHECGGPNMSLFP